MTGGTLRVSLDASAVPAEPGGAGRYVLELARALDRHRDVDLVLWCRHNDANRWPELAPGATVHHEAPNGRPARLAWEQLRLPARCGHAGVAVHHGPHYTMPLRARVPKVVTIHDLTFFDHPEWHQRTKAAFFRRAIRTASRQADALVAVSATTAGRLQDLLHPTAPVHVVAHGVDHDRFHPVPDDGSGARQPYIAFLGTLEPRKDVPTLVRAFDKLAGRHGDVSLVIAGAPGWGVEAVTEAVAASPNRDRIHITGYVAEADKPVILRRAAVVAYPSLEEGFGLPALEAMACGTPLVTTAGSAMEEVAGNAALLVPAGDADALAGALDAALAGGEEIERRRALGLELAARYTWTACADGHVAVYRSVIA